jgi:hypothetical protein
MYDRAGYGQPENGSNPKTSARLRSEPDSVINKFTYGRKVILIGYH